jgi:hypothetical protein
MPIRVVHQNREDEKNSSEFFKIDQSSEARLGHEKNSSEFFEAIHVKTVRS